MNKKIVRTDPKLQITNADIYGLTIQYPAPVITLTILDQSTLKNGNVRNESKILVVVRDPETNINHPNVISTPTQRIPTSLHKEILESEEGKQSQQDISSASELFVNNWQNNGHNPIIYAIESLMSKKIGLADQLEKNKLNLRGGWGYSKLTTLFIRAQTTAN